MTIPLMILDDDCLILGLTRLRVPIQYVTMLDIRVTQGIEGVLDDRNLMVADVGTLTAVESIIGEMECS